MATLIEVADQTNAILATVYGKKGARPYEPIRISRPGRRVQETERPKPLRGEALAAAFRKLQSGMVQYTPDPPKKKRKKD